MPFDAKLPVKDAHIRHGDLAAYAGIASGYVTAWADALGTTPAAIEAAAEEVPPLMDTAEPPSAYDVKLGPRPDAPSVRCIAWTTGQLGAVRAAVDRFTPA